MSSPISNFIRSGVIVGAGAATQYGMRFVRNVLLAHLLSRGDFGVCVAMTALLSSAQLLTDFGLEKLLIQEREIDDRRLQPVLATLVAARMVCASALLFCFSSMLAKMFGVPAAAGSFRLLSLSLIPLGFINLDTTRLQKYHRFGPDAVTRAAFPTLEFVLAITAAFFRHSYVVVPYALIVSAIGAATISQFLSRRRLAFGWDVDLVKHALRFGMPLVFGGLIMLAASQADRILIGAALGVGDLALYGAVMAIISSPSMLLAGIGSSLFLPRLADAAANQEKFRTRFLQVGVAVAIVSGIIQMPLLVFGGDIVASLFGAAYRPPSELIWVITLGQAAFLLRFWPNLGALARGDTKNLVLSNSFRMGGLGLALSAAHFQLGLISIAASFSCGEILGLVGAFWFLHRRQPHLYKGSLAIFSALAITFACGMLIAWLLEASIYAKIIATFLIIAGLLLSLPLLSVEARRLLAVWGVNSWPYSRS